MEFSLQISNFPWLMSSINRIGKNRHGKGSKEEEEMKRRMLFSSYSPLYRRHCCHFPEQVRCSSVNHCIFLAIDQGNIQRALLESIPRT